MKGTKCPFFLIFFNFFSAVLFCKRRLAGAWLSPLAGGTRQLPEPQLCRWSESRALRSNRISYRNEWHLSALNASVPPLSPGFARSGS